MKRMLSIICAFTMLFLLCSCTDNNPNKATEYVSATTSISKESVKEFLLLLEKTVPSGHIDGYKIREENCYNVTPVEVAAQTDMKIFKFSDSCASFVMVDSEIYTICEFFGGYGFVNAVPCDFDNDGHKDLLVASSWGSGMHRSIISVFNSVTKESIVIYNTFTTDNPGIDLFVAAESPVFSSKEIEDWPIYYQVYSAEITVNDMVEYNLADLSYVATDLVGSIEIENGKPVFKPYQN